MKCEFCDTELEPDGGGLVCPNCGNWLSALEVKYGKEPPIEDYETNKWSWH